jgi:hypothetical protein
MPYRSVSNKNPKQKKSLGLSVIRQKEHTRLSGCLGEPFSSLGIKENENFSFILLSQIF